MRHVPFSVWRLTFAYALMMAGGAMMVLIAGIIGTTIAPSPGLATLPIALTVVGVAASTLPTGQLMQRFGRRAVFIAYGVLAVLAGLAAALSLLQDSFAGFCLAAMAIGWSSAAGHQYRFAALELVPAPQAAAATSALLLGGILGAFVGPELALFGRSLLAVEFAGSYLLLAVSYVVGTLIVAGYREPRHAVAHNEIAGRPLRVILRNPVVVLAIASAAMSYALMSFVMTATPISMHQHAGHSLEATKWVIQAHIAAMYLPSLVFAALHARFGLQRLLWLGVACFALTLVVALAQQALWAWFLSLILLGLGWNLLFLGGTNLLPQGYQPVERFRVQAMNDFLAFTVQATVALGSGWFLFRFGWHGVLWTGVALLLAYVLLLWRCRQVSPRLRSGG
jgi:MFS family permease